MRLLPAAVAALLLSAAPAVAADTPVSLYQAGHYTEAEAAGLALNNAQGLAIATRAAMAAALTRDQLCLECFKHAEMLARRTIAADPKLPEGYIYLAASLNYEAHLIGDMAAESQGLAGQIKGALDTALAADPKNPWALAALGSWHIEIAARAGPVIANLLFGAKFSIGQENYAKAFTQAPDDPVLRYQHALALAEYDINGERHDIENDLTRIADKAPGSAYDAVVKERALKLLEAVRGADPVCTQRLVRHDLGYPDTNAS
jgi:hypothetical protein